jgi:hypothetical protein
MRIKVLISAVVAAASVGALLPATASAQRYEGYGYSGRGYDQGYDGRGGDWRAHERWEHRRAWQERRRWERQEARHRYWQHEHGRGYYGERHGYDRY